MSKKMERMNERFMKFLGAEKVEDLTPIEDIVLHDAIESDNAYEYLNNLMSGTEEISSLNKFNADLFMVCHYKEIFKIWNSILDENNVVEFEVNPLNLSKLAYMQRVTELIIEFEQWDYYQQYCACAIRLGNYNKEVR